jgi:hypothetical protein
VSVLEIRTDGGATWFKPGETIAGTASWHLESGAEALEVRLFWFTSGKGSRDVEVVARKHVARPEPSGSRSFEFKVPRGPYSFSGALITLSWALELVVLPDGATERFDLVVGPRPVEVSLK